MNIHIATGEGEQTNVLPINFVFKNPIINYETEITLKTADKTDIRRYRLRITSFPKPVKAQLEMTAPAREMVLQEIPIVNNTDRDWHIRIVVQGSEDHFSHYFAITNLPTEPGAPLGKDFKDFLVKKKSTGNVPIIFYP